MCSTLNYPENFASFLYFQIHFNSSTKDGEIARKIGANIGTFSLGITIDDQARMIAIVRGRPLLRVFQVTISIFFFCMEILIKFRTFIAHIIRNFMLIIVFIYSDNLLTHNTNKSLILLEW